MKKGIPGHGAVSIVLVFTVLCLTLFAVITYSQSRSDKALADAAARMVLGYYEADLTAERVLAELRLNVPESGLINGINVSVTNIDDKVKVQYSIPVTEDKQLHVEAVISPSSDYEILVWKMSDASAWVPDVYHPLLDTDRPLFLDYKGLNI